MCVHGGEGEKGMERRLEGTGKGTAAAAAAALLLFPLLLLVVVQYCDCEA